MSPCCVRFRHADDVCLKGCDAGEIVVVILAGCAICETFNILKKDSKICGIAVCPGLAVGALEVNVDVGYVDFSAES